MYFPIWLALYHFRKDTRDEMRFMGILCLIGSVLGAAFIWTYDWWLPINITGTRVGIEDAILGFFVGSITAGLYEGIFRKKLVNDSKPKWDRHLFWYTIFLATLIGGVLFFGVGIHSFFAVTLSMFIPTLVIYFLRPDLVKPSLITGALITIVSYPFFYWTVFLIDPSAINWWFHDQLTGILWLGVPMEDIVWFYFAGMFISPLYELWKGKKFVKMK